MLKWIGLILSFVMGRFNNHAPPMNFNFKEAAMGVFDEMTFKSRKAASLLLVALASVIFICGGFFISLIDATRQYDQTGGIALSSTFIAGAILALVAVGIFTWVFTSAWPGAQNERLQRKLKNKMEDFAEHAAPPPPPPSSIEHALSALIMDFVHERESNRERRGPEGHHPPPPRPHDREAAFADEVPPVYPH
jgi:hypothetical protein